MKTYPSKFWNAPREPHNGPNTSKCVSSEFPRLRAYTDVVSSPVMVLGGVEVHRSWVLQGSLARHKDEDPFVKIFKRLWYATE